MDYDALRAEQAGLRRRNIHRGIGIASFIEITNPSAAFYGVGGARISSQDGVAVRLDADRLGDLPDQHHRAGAGLGIADGPDRRRACSAFRWTHVRVILGDTDNTPYGGGTWASRGAGIGGEAALQAAKVLRGNILEVAGGDPAVRGRGTRYRRTVRS